MTKQEIILKQNTMIMQNVRLQAKLTEFQTQEEIIDCNTMIFESITRKDMINIMKNWVYVHINDEDLDQNLINRMFNAAATSYKRQRFLMDGGTKVGYDLALH